MLSGIEIYIHGIYMYIQLEIAFWIYIYIPCIYIAYRYTLYPMLSYVYPMFSYVYPMFSSVFFRLKTVYIHR